MNTGSVWASVGGFESIASSARPFRSVFVVLISDFKYLLPYRPTTTTTTNTRTLSSPRVCLYNRNREEGPARRFEIVSYQQWLGKGVAAERPVSE